MVCGFTLPLISKCERFVEDALEGSKELKNRPCLQPLFCQVL